MYEGVDDGERKQRYVRQQLADFVSTHVMCHIPTLATENDLQCPECGRQYKRKTFYQKHLQTAHNINVNIPLEQNAQHQDAIYNYTHGALMLLLIRHDHNNAIKMGDGARVIRLYRYMLFFYKATRCPKYAYGTLETLAQVTCLLSPRKAHELVWNRFANSQGKCDTNLPLDLDIEHHNLMFKTDAHACRGELTKTTMDRVSRSVGHTDEITENYDRVTCVKKPSGRHTKRDRKQDILLLANQLHTQVKSFDNVPGRFHESFPDFPGDILNTLDMDKFGKWMRNSLQTFGKQHFYKM